MLWNDVQPLLLKTPGVMTASELAAWAQIGKNSVQQLVSRFGIREITAGKRGLRFSAPLVLKNVIGIAPQSREELDQMLVPLQKASWVAQLTGLSVSTINAAACANRSGLPAPVELTRTDPDQAAPRSRRWVPAQVIAHLNGEDVPFTTQAHESPRGASDDDRNVFPAFSAANAEISLQCQL